ncbi:MAG: hypothetical protein ACE5JL_09670, partial [Dehalococcoidia bacterium]
MGMRAKVVGLILALAVRFLAGSAFAERTFFARDPIERYEIGTARQEAPVAEEAFSAFENTRTEARFPNAITVREKLAFWSTNSDEPLRGVVISPYRTVPEVGGPTFGASGLGDLPYTQADIDNLAARDIDYVTLSLPGWVTDRTLAQDLHDTLHDLRGMFANAGLPVVLHFYPRAPMEQDEAAHDVWLAFWRSIAAQYRDDPLVVAYDLRLAPYGEDEDGNLRQQAAPPQVDIRLLAATVREVDPDTPLWVGPRMIEPQTNIAGLGIREMEVFDGFYAPTLYSASVEPMMAAEEPFQEWDMVPTDELEGVGTTYPQDRETVPPDQLRKPPVMQEPSQESQTKPTDRVYEPISIGVKEVRPDYCQDAVYVELDRWGNNWKGDVLIALRYQGKALHAKFVSAKDTSAWLTLLYYPKTENFPGYGTASFPPAPNFMNGASFSIQFYAGVNGTWVKALTPDYPVTLRTYPQPVINSLTPKSGYLGDTILLTFTGTHLSIPGYSTQMRVYHGSQTWWNGQWIKSQPASSGTVVVAWKPASNALLGTYKLYLDHCRSSN